MRAQVCILRSFQGQFRSKLDGLPTILNDMAGPTISGWDIAARETRIRIGGSLGIKDTRLLFHQRHRLALILSRISLSLIHPLGSS
jgi:hypothetical protein